MASSIPTFARTEPPDTQVSCSWQNSYQLLTVMAFKQVAKSVISLLRYYSWKKFSIIYEESQYTVADALHKQAVKMNLTINHMEKYIDNHKCCEDSLPCCRSGYWYQVGRLYESFVTFFIFFSQSQFIQNTMNRTRIYVFLGGSQGLFDMMNAMDTVQLFSKGEYMVIFPDMMTYSQTQVLFLCVATFGDSCFTSGKLRSIYGKQEKCSVMNRRRSKDVLVACLWWCPPLPRKTTRTSQKSSENTILRNHSTSLHHHYFISTIFLR